MPVLEHDGFALYETQAILRYLDRILPAPALSPADPKAAARMDQVMNISDWYLFQGVGNVIAFQRIVKPALMGGTADEAAIAACMPAAHGVQGAEPPFGRTGLLHGQGGDAGRHRRRMPNGLPGRDARVGRIDGGGSQSGCVAGADELPAQHASHDLGAGLGKGESCMSGRIRVYGAAPNRETKGHRMTPSIETEAERKLIVALDMPDAGEAYAFRQRLALPEAIAKIGLELLFAGGVELARKLAAEGVRVFVDAKLFDIGNTVERATARVAALGAAFLTVHAQDAQTVAAAVRGRAGSGLKLLGITLLTSAAPDSLGAQGISLSSAELVLRRARFAADGGFDGVVSSPLEARDLKAAFGDRPRLSARHPAARPASRPSATIKRAPLLRVDAFGAQARTTSWLVCSITQANDPVAVAAAPSSRKWREALRRKRAAWDDTPIAEVSTLSIARGPGPEAPPGRCSMRVFLHPDGGNFRRRHQSLARHRRPLLLNAIGRHFLKFGAAFPNLM